MLHAVIMAGGSGTRFWPRSTDAKPKQFLNIFGNKTMLQATVDRINSLIPADRVWVITNQKYVDLVQDQLPDVPEQNIVGEPVAKDTAPCVALAAALIHEQDSDGTMMVLPADHQVTEPDEFIDTLKSAEAKAQADDSLVTIGIKPDRPETGYGYIEFDKDKSEEYNGREIKKVNQFREKPDLVTARQFIHSGNFLWNSGMFIWKTSTILDQFNQHLPSVGKQAQEFSSALTSTDQQQAIHDFYQGCPSISIDYGIMEQSDTVYVIPGTFGWNDVGSWKAVYDLREKNEDGNVIQSDTTVLTESTDNLIHSNGDKIVALAGVEDLAVVQTDNAILVCNLNEAQDVKQIVNQLDEDEKLKKYL
ncbi:mannose-1-phosphate guanylyltransferase [Fodinibius salinus]|uniref:mannose-1-phosphate guanylyltransferase n=1 Tax=Fodinibius salinus TaxID=860790 RepID=A0A5D3YIZ7_9BACT|nr:mannose-1-phosphate guanylyltransferase [Fodinibius salinus]TYP93753.1 mannose-1-phosphate guanylyltransferase [Fodinibius salinus]